MDGEIDSAEYDFIIHSLIPEALDADSTIESQAGSEFTSRLRAIGILSCAVLGH